MGGGGHYVVPQEKLKVSDFCVARPVVALVFVKLIRVGWASTRQAVTGDFCAASAAAVEAPGGVLLCYRGYGGTSMCSSTLRCFRLRRSKAGEV